MARPGQYDRGTTTSSTGNLESLFTQMSSQQLEANKRRRAQVEAIYDEVIARYGPGGTFGKGYLEQLEQQKTRDIGAGTQQMISSGLYGTTTTAGLPGRWEAEVGAPSRLKLEDLMMERLSGAQLGKASFLENIQEPYPDYSALMQAGAAAGSAGGGGMSYSSTADISDYMRRFQESRSGSADGGITGGTFGEIPGVPPAGGTAGGGTRPVSLPKELLESSGIYQQHKQYENMYNKIQTNIAFYRYKIGVDPKNRAVYESAIKDLETQAGNLKK